MRTAFETETPVPQTPEPVTPAEPPERLAPAEEPERINPAPLEPPD